MNIKDIAKIAGVGVSTVSRVINNQPDVKLETRQKVLEIIKESKYVPNNSARILKQNNTKNIGVLVKGVFNPFFSEMINIIGTSISETGYTMILQQNDYDNQDDINSLIAFIKEKRLLGVICLGGNFMNVKEEVFQCLNVPVVLTSVNTISKEGKSYYSSIGIDNKKGGYKATKYLIDNKHKNIAVMLGEKDDIGISLMRLKGYIEALKENNIIFNEENILIGNYNSEDAYRTSKKFLSKRKDITAIFSISDVMAIGVAKAIIDSNLKVGKDISLIGFDGMSISKFYNPAITTLKQP
ncbi:MAG: LacI family DNA-binding transcriptional regulator, partial [Sarcina sp.]